MLLTPDAYKFLNKVVIKLKHQPKVDASQSQGIFPKTTEFILSKILELAYRNAQDKHRAFITAQDLADVVKRNLSLSELIGDVKAPRGKPLQTFVITLNTYFRRTNDETDEKDPSRTRLDKIVKERVLPEVRTWVLDESIKWGNLPIKSYKNLKAHAKGKITFEVSDVTEDVVKVLVEALNTDSLEDGSYESAPGTGMVVETKRDPNQELGLIDYRRRIDFWVKGMKLKN